MTKRLSLFLFILPDLKKWAQLSGNSLSTSPFFFYFALSEVHNTALVIFSVYFWSDLLNAFLPFSGLYCLYNKTGYAFLLLLHLALEGQREFYWCGILMK